MSLAQTIQQLYQQYGDLSGISIECQKDLVAIGIKNKAATAEIFLQGAQLSRYCRHQESPILFLSDACDYKEGVSLRGGIPICWPWFGNLDKNPEAVTQQIPAEYVKNAPAHGFVRGQDWQLVAIETPSDSLTTIELEYKNKSSNSYWPFAAHLHYKVTVGETLSACLTVSNMDAHAFTYSSALHSYFCVSDIHRARIHGFEEAAYIDAADHWSAKQQQQSIRFTNEVDRVYGTAGTHVQLKDTQRTLAIDSKGSHSTVVWNPWIDKSQRLSQFNNDDYCRMVCIETANVMDDVITLGTGEKHALSITIR